MVTSSASPAAPIAAAEPGPGATIALGMSTAAFTVCFAAWTIFSILGIQIQKDLGLNETQFGLLILAEYFNDEGWYWGAAYNREDSMHFEVGEETLRAWLAEWRL